MQREHFRTARLAGAGVGMGAATRASARGYNVPQTRPKPTPQKNLATDHYSRDFHECNAPIRVKKLDREGSPFGESLRRQTSLIRRQTSLIRRQTSLIRRQTSDSSGARQVTHQAPDKSR